MQPNTGHSGETCRPTPLLPPTPVFPANFASLPSSNIDPEAESRGTWPKRDGLRYGRQFIVEKVMWMRYRGRWHASGVKRKSFSILSGICAV